MSLQDDVFDVADTLKDTPMADVFDRIVTRLWEYESENDDLRSRVAIIDGLKRLLTETK